MQLWDLDNWSLIWSKKPAPGKTLTQINFSPDGQFLVTGGGEPGALVWEAATGEFVMALLGHTAVDVQCYLQSRRRSDPQQQH
jgi:WD40 repeat protein